MGSRQLRQRGRWRETGGAFLRFHFEVPFSGQKGWVVCRILLLQVVSCSLVPRMK
jgi:hypothetical protein